MYLLRIPLSRVLAKALLSALLLSVAACASLRQAPPALPAEVTLALQQAGIDGQSVALVVRPVSGEGARVVEHQAGQPFAPASLMKLVTSQAALELLGPGHLWQTRVHATGRLEEGRLNGDLIIEGGGDPRFAHEDLARLLRELRQMGLREIGGDLVIDRSLFQVAAADPGAFDGQPDRAYNAQPDALLLDTKALSLTLRPDGERVLALSEPPLDGFAIRPPALSNGSCGKLREQLQPTLSAQGLQFGGSYPSGCGERELAFHLHTLDHVQFFGAVFRALWREQGGSLTGQVREGRVPDGSRQWLAWPSRPLAQVLVDINKQSNNAMARNLMLSLVAERGGKPATPAAAAELMLAWMSASGIPAQGAIIENGSGLSRAERLSAATLTAVLQRGWQQPTMPELLASLPVAGIDGTMVKRNGDSPVRGHAHIKTGSLAGVAGIAGYVSAKSGRRVTVVCLINHPNANGARSAFETLLDWIYANY